jgi:predicted amidohydrolase
MKRYYSSSLLLSILLSVSNATLASSPTSDISTEKKHVKIAMAQIICIDGDKAGNLVRIENAISEANNKQADLVVFPESSLLGWENPDAHQRACPIPGEDSEFLCKLALKFKMFICIGLDEKDGDKLYDAAILIDENGTILLKHRKINVLPELMTPPYSVGDGVQVVKTTLGNVGVMICADSFMENLIESMRSKKPDLLLIPYGWAALEKDWPEHGKELVKVVKNVAGKVNCPVIGTNLIGQISHGPWSGQVYGGQSVAFCPENNMLFIGKDRERDILLFTVDLKD